MISKRSISTWISILYNKSGKHGRVDSTLLAGEIPRPRDRPRVAGTAMRRKLPAKYVGIALVGCNQFSVSCLFRIFNIVNDIRNCSASSGVNFHQPCCSQLAHPLIKKGRAAIIKQPCLRFSYSSLLSEAKASAVNLTPILNP